MKVLEIQTWISEFSPDEINVDKLKEYLEFVQKLNKVEILRGTLNGIM